MNYGGQNGWPEAGGASGSGELIFVSHSSLAGQRRALPPSGKLIIGREPGCDITFDPTKDRVVGRRHAQLEIRPEGVYLTDLNSRNGTFYRGTPVKEIPIPLMDGDQFRLGEDGPVMQVKLAAQAAPEHTQVLRPKSRAADGGGMAPAAQSYGPPTGMVDVSGWANQRTTADPQAGWGGPPQGGAAGWGAPPPPQQPPAQSPPRNAGGWGAAPPAPPPAQQPAWGPSAGGAWGAPPAPPPPAQQPAWNQGTTGGWGGPPGPPPAAQSAWNQGVPAWNPSAPPQVQGQGSSWGGGMGAEPPAPAGHAGGVNPVQQTGPISTQSPQAWGTGGAAWNSPPASGPAGGADPWGGAAGSGWGQPAPPPGPSPRPATGREPGPIFGGASAGGWGGGPAQARNDFEPEREDTSAFMASLGNPMGNVGAPAAGKAPSVPPNLAGGATSLFGNEGWNSPPRSPSGLGGPQGTVSGESPGRPPAGWSPAPEPPKPAQQSWSPAPEPPKPPQQSWGPPPPEPAAPQQGWAPAPEPAGARSAAAKKPRPAPPPPEEEEEEEPSAQKGEGKTAPKSTGGFQWTNERIAYARQAAVVFLVFALACAGGFTFAWLNPSPLFPPTPPPEAPAQ